MNEVRVLIASMRSSTHLGMGELLKRNPDGRAVKVFYAGVIDESYMPGHFFQDGYEVSPKLDTEEYLDFITRCCKENLIDVLIPSDTRILTPSSSAVLEDRGIAVVRQMSNTQLELLDDKGLFYQQAAVAGFAVPRYRVVNALNKFKEAVRLIQTEQKVPCFKPRISMGGRGFRIIRDFNELDNLITGYQRPTITYENAVRLFSQQETFSDMLVMEYLDGREYSIDCLSWQGEPYSIVPRRKIEYAQMGSYAVQLLEDNHELIELSKKLVKLFQLDYITNIQVRYAGDTPYLLEINPRASGGITLSCLSGVNFPYLAVKLALGEAVEPCQPELDRLVVKRSQEFAI